MSRYELSGSSEEQNNPQQIRRHNNEAGGRHNKSPHQSNSNTQRPPKSVRSPEPLVEPQKLIYIIGYGEGQSSSSNGTADRAGLIRLILIILPILIPFLLLIWSDMEQKDLIRYFDRSGKAWSDLLIGLEGSDQMSWSIKNPLAPISTKVLSFHLRSVPVVFLVIIHHLNCSSSSSSWTIVFYTILLTLP